MKKTGIYLIIVLFVIDSQVLLAQTSKVGTTAAQFLKIAVGPRATAMGEAHAGMANDISAIYWNPAGLALLRQREAIFQHSFWLASLKFDFASIVFPLKGNNTVGAFVTLLGTPEDEVRTVMHPEGTGEMFNAVDMALGLSYSRMMTDQFAIGMNVKYIRQKIWTMCASGWAVDFGSIYTTDFRDFRIGLAVSNFGTPIQLHGPAANVFVDIAPEIPGHDEKARAELISEKWELPIGFRMGFAIDPVRSKNMRLTLASDWTHPNDNNEYINFGFEYAIREIVLIRSGFRGLGMQDMEGGLTAGMGFRIKFSESLKAKLDYAFADYGKLEATHRYAISLVF
ncbi:PorV/PorQ family protein [candidate division KSB1 bacterium]|nr:PorV/PorQ family protein [candidate division KSB1 bacterium]